MVDQVHEFLSMFGLGLRRVRPCGADANGHVGSGVDAALRWRMRWRPRRLNSGPTLVYGGGDERWQIWDGEAWA